MVMCGCGACVCLSKSDNARKLITTFNCRCNLFSGREVFTRIFLALEVKSDPRPALAVFGALPKKVF